MPICSTRTIVLSQREQKRVSIKLTNVLKYLCFQFIIVIIWHLSGKHGLLCRERLTGIAWNTLTIKVKQGWPVE